MCLRAACRLDESEHRGREHRMRVDQSRHYLNRESPDRTLVGLILEHFDQLEHWSAELIEPER